MMFSGGGLLLLLLYLGAQVAHARVLPSIHQLVTQARAFSQDPDRHNHVAIKDRMGVLLLHSRKGIEDEASEEFILYKSVSLLQKFIAPYTPLDIYIFVNAADAPKDPGTHAFTSLGRNIAVLPVLDNHWQHRRYRDAYIEDDVVDPSVQYKLMGQWRLEVAFTFAALMGHEFMLQFDDDSFVMGAYPVNLVQQMRDTKSKLAAWMICVDPPYYFNGLPELARTFITMQSGNHTDRTVFNAEMEAQAFASTRYRHCKPQDITGMHTQMRQPDGSSTGFDNIYLYGNFIIVKADMWMQPRVQDFVAMCLHSGGVHRYRWIDQSVLSMVWQLFVETSQVLMLGNVLPYLHKKNWGPGEWREVMANDSCHAKLNTTGRNYITSAASPGSTSIVLSTAGMCNNTQMCAPGTAPCDIGMCIVSNNGRYAAAMLHEAGGALCRFVLFPEKPDYPKEQLWCSAGGQGRGGPYEASIQGGCIFLKAQDGYQYWSSTNTTGSIPVPDSQHTYNLVIEDDGVLVLRDAGTCQIFWYGSGNGMVP